MWVTCYNAPDLALVRARGIPSMRKKSAPQTEATWLLLCLLKVLTSLKSASLLEGQGRHRSQPWFTPLDVFANYVPMWIHAHVWFLILTVQFYNKLPFPLFQCRILWSGFWIFHPRIYVQFENDDNLSIKTLNNILCFHK